MENWRCALHGGLGPQAMPHTGLCAALHCRLNPRGDGSYGPRPRCTLAASSLSPWCSVGRARLLWIVPCLRCCLGDPARALSASESPPSAACRTRRPNERPRSTQLLCLSACWKLRVRWSRALPHTSLSATATRGDGTCNGLPDRPFRTAQAGIASQHTHPPRPPMVAAAEATRSRVRCL